MFTTATKIYLLTNAIFTVGISVATEDIGFGLLVAPFSLVFTAPLVVFTSGLLWTLSRLKATKPARWALFLAGMAALTYLPFFIFGPGQDELRDLSIAYASAFISILLLRKSVSSHFLSAQSPRAKVKREAWSA